MATNATDAPDLVLDLEDSVDLRSNQDNLGVITLLPNPVGFVLGEPISIVIGADKSFAGVDVYDKFSKRRVVHRWEYQPSPNFAFR
jgi:hypothetical protein